MQHRLQGGRDGILRNLVNTEAEEAEEAVGDDIETSTDLEVEVGGL